MQNCVCVWGGGGGGGESSPARFALKASLVFFTLMTAVAKPARQFSYAMQCDQIAGWLRNWMTVIFC